MVMGLDEDAEDHKAVASSIFITVAIYAVCSFRQVLWESR